MTKKNPIAAHAQMRDGEPDIFSAIHGPMCKITFQHDQPETHKEEQELRKYLAELLISTPRLNLTFNGNHRDTVGNNVPIGGSSIQFDWDDDLTIDVSFRLSRKKV